ncbi:MAG TPA: 50S ribosomal protein L25 [Candidatus Acidoferrales bacterium]|nr:50S ribosomal protein L25 [Candidatus Acidoferrales bacterium]
MQIDAVERTPAGNSSRRLGQVGQLPAVVYGHGVGARAVGLDLKDFQRVYRRAGHTQLVDLAVAGTRPVKVLIKSVQISPRRGLPIHVDFHQVSLMEKLHTEVPLVVVGESELVKRGDAELLQLVHVIHVECLPAAIPELIEVDCSTLAAVDEGIRVQELLLPVGVTVTDDPEEVVVKLSAPRGAEAADEAAVALAGPPTVEEAPSEG